jgi:hypothetical protein
MSVEVWCTKRRASCGFTLEPETTEAKSGIGAYRRNFIVVSDVSTGTWKSMGIGSSMKAAKNLYLRRRNRLCALTRDTFQFPRLRCGSNTSFSVHPKHPYTRTRSPVPTPWRIRQSKRRMRFHWCPKTSRSGNQGDQRPDETISIVPHSGSRLLEVFFETEFDNILGVKYIYPLYSVSLPFNIISIFKHPRHSFESGANRLDTHRSLLQSSQRCVHLNNPNCRRNNRRDANKAQHSDSQRKYRRVPSETIFTYTQAATNREMSAIKLKCIQQRISPFLERQLPVQKNRRPGRLIVVMSWESQNTGANCHGSLTRAAANSCLGYKSKHALIQQNEDDAVHQV